MHTCCFPRWPSEQCHMFANDNISSIFSRIWIVVHYLIIKWWIISFLQITIFWVNHFSVAFHQNHYIFPKATLTSTVAHLFVEANKIIKLADSPCRAPVMWKTFAVDDEKRPALGHYSTFRSLSIQMMPFQMVDRLLRHLAINRVLIIILCKRYCLSLHRPQSFGPNWRSKSMSDTSGPFY